MKRPYAALLCFAIALVCLFILVDLSQGETRCGWYQQSKNVEYYVCESEVYGAVRRKQVPAISTATWISEVPLHHERGVFTSRRDARSSVEKEAGR